MSTTAPGASGAAAEANAQALRAMGAGDFAGARALLQRVATQYPQQVSLWLNLAACHRALGDMPAAMNAVEQALRSDPRSFHGLLMKGSLQERAQQPRRAAVTYGHAIGLAPPAQALDPATARALAHARDVRAAYLEELAAHVRAAQPSDSVLTPVQASRMEDFVEIALGRRRNFRQEPTEFFYPGLPAIEFHERADFPWLAAVEAQTAAIREELRALVADGYGEFTPYVQYPDHVPLDQWTELNHSPRWGALHLLHYGVRVEANCSRCPQTMATLAEAPQPQVPGRSPAAMFSALQPGTTIPPHTGVANTRLVVHLPLVVPEGCAFRVGNQVRLWREGQAWVFDDTVEHEAWNRSSEPRVILIFDVWNPRLSAQERDAITRVMTAIDRFNGGAQQTGL